MRATSSNAITSILIVLLTDLSCRVQKLLALVPSTLNWKLMDRAPLKTWVHPDGKLVLLGDSCHPMLVRIARFLPLKSIA